MKILYTAFNGKTNSSKVLLDYVKVDKKDKLYLKNRFTTCVEQLYQKMENNDYDLILSFGEGDKDLNHIKIETIGRKDNERLSTNYSYREIIDDLENKNVEYTISKDAGNYLCNHIYYHGLKYINENRLKTKMLFIHIPPLSKINDIENFASIFIKNAK